MNGKMQVFFVKQTGHVLAAFTRTADPEGKPHLKDLVGSGLLVRNAKKVASVPAPAAGDPIGETLLVPLEALDLSVVDFDPNIFSDPRSFVTSGGKVAKLGLNPLLIAPSMTPMPPPSSLPPIQSPPLVNFSASRVTVQIELDTTDDKGVLFVLQEAEPLPGDEPERRIAEGAVKSGTHFASLDLKMIPSGSVASIPNKEFFILALIAGYQPAFRMRQPAT